MSDVKYTVIAIGLVHHKGKILLGFKDPKSKKRLPGQWFFLGGRVEYDEKIEAAIVRELKEEASIEVEVKRLICTETINEVWEDNTDHHYCFIYYEAIPKSSNTEVKTRAGDDIIKLQWAEIEKLKEFIKTSIPVEVLNFLENIKI